MDGTDTINFCVFSFWGDSNVQLTVIPTFLSLVVSFHKSLWDKDTYLIASLGYSAGEYSDLQQIVEYAEKAMYEDKQMFYIKYPNMKR